VKTRIKLSDVEQSAVRLALGAEAYRLREMTANTNANEINADEMLYLKTRLAQTDKVLGLMYHNEIILEKKSR
jgi:hypothetical protein